MTRAQPVPALTQVAVRALRWDGQRRTIRDTEVRGLLVRVNKASVTYALQREFRGETVLLTLGNVQAHTLKSARSWAIQMQASFAAGIDPRRPSGSIGEAAPTLREVYDARCKWLLGNRRSATVQSYQDQAGKFTDWMDMPIADISTEMLRNRHAALTVKVGARGGPITANRAMKWFRESWNFCHEVMHRLPPSPMPARYLLNPEVRSGGKALAAEELIQLAPALHKHPMQMFVLLTGLRKTTVLSLRWDWLGLLSLEIPGAAMKSGRDHFVPLSVPAFDLLSDLKHRSVFEEGRRSDLVFQGHPWRLKNMPYGHVLRHTYRTHALAAGVPEPMIDMLMDHKVSDGIGKLYTNRMALQDVLRKHQETITERIWKLVRTE